MVQTGDPTGTGTGGPGYRFDDEPVRQRYQAGIVAMANAGPNTNGSQFFIMHRSQALPPNYTIFGRVSGGMDVVDAIAGAPVKNSPSGEMSSPRERLTIERVTIDEQPAADTVQ
jgi:peptidylprolyl isomerase